MIAGTRDFSDYGYVPEPKIIAANEQVKRPPPGEIVLRSEHLGYGVRYHVESCFGKHWSRVLVFEGGYLILTLKLPTIKDHYRLDRRVNDARNMALRHYRLVEAAMIGK